jgi:transposase-like protein
LYLGEEAMRVMSNGRTRRTQEEWQQIVDRFVASGLTSQQFCEKEQLVQTSLLRWRQKLAAASSPSPFIPVRAASADRLTTWRFSVTLPNGCRLSFEG